MIKVRSRISALLCVALLSAAALLLAGCNLFTPRYTLSVSTQGQGTVTQSIAQKDYLSGTSVVLTATPAASSYFGGWTGDSTDTASTITVVMDGNKTLTAVFGVVTSFSLSADWSSTTTVDSLNTVTALSTGKAAAPLPTRRISEQASAASSGTSSDRIIVTLKRGTAVTASLGSASAGYGRVIRHIDLPSAALQVVKVDTSGGKTLQQALDYYRSLPGVASAEPDVRAHVFGVPNDPYFQYQWDLTQLNMPAVWDSQTASSSVTVAVLDTGLYRPLPDNPPNIALGYNAITRTADTANTIASLDDNGHGTHVADTLAEATNNDLELAGMAYGVTILPVKVMGQDGSGNDSDIVAGINWVINSGGAPRAQIINLSLGSSAPDAALQIAITDAYNAGIAIIAASGNDGADAVSYPAADSNVLSVGATGYNKELAYYSNYGANLDVVAPGGDDSVFPQSSPEYYLDWIWQETIAGYDPSTQTTSYTEGAYGFEGTSMAAPHVSALAALLLSKNPGTSPATIYSRIESTAEDLGVPGRDNTYGYGLIDPAAALSVNITAYPHSQQATGFVDAVDSSRSYSFNAISGSTASFAASVTNGPGKLVLTLYDQAGSLLASSTTSTSPTLSYSVTATGNYRVQVTYAK